MKNKNESGVVAVEASIIVTLVLITITIMFYIGMVMYQQTTLSVTANRTASSIAQVYSNTLRDPFTGYIDPNKAYQPVTYGNMKTDAYLEAIKDKGIAFGQYRLKKAQIIPSTDREVDVQVVNKPNEILKGQIVVTIKDTYSVPLLGFFGVDAKATYTGTGRADCVDYLEYLQGVGALANPEESPIPSLPDSDTCLVTFIKSKSDGGWHAAVPVLRGKSIITSNPYSHCTMPANPDLKEMQFTGWVTESGQLFTAATQVDGNLTVYGTWNCTVTLDPTGSKDNPGKVSPTTVTAIYCQPVTLPAATRSGYAFEGWFTEKDGKGTKYLSGSTPIPGNITLYAHWRCTHAAFDSKMLDAGNCQTQSTWQFDCKTCDYSYKAKGAYGACAKGDKTTQTKPSCTFAGVYVVKCKFCPKILETGEIAKDPNGHKFAANGSDFDTKLKISATCTSAGFDGSQCSLCNTRKGKTIAALGHSLDSGTVTKQATCYSVGTKTFKCTRSGCTYSEKREIAKKAHNWDNGTVTTQASCTEVGKKTFKCKNSGCSSQKYEDIPMIPHDFTARCGVEHDLGADAYKMKGTHGAGAGKYPSAITVTAECVVCRECGEFWDGKPAVNGVETAGKVKRNGVWTSIGMYCRSHKVNGKVIVDDAYKDKYEKRPKPKKKVKHYD